MCGSPLEQFKVFPLYVCRYSEFIDLSITNFTVFLFLNFAVLIWFLWFGISNSKLGKTNLQIIVDNIYWFIVETIEQQTGKGGLKYIFYYF